MTALSDLVALGEGFTIEFKRSLSSDLGREICAFANATGGVILLGVDDDGTVCGVEANNRMKSRVQSIARSADPPISVEVESMGDALVGDRWITNAGAWLLAENIRKFHASAHLSCALFQGTTKTQILDRRDFPGDIFR